MSETVPPGMARPMNVLYWPNLTTDASTKGLTEFDRLRFNLAEPRPALHVCNLINVVDPDLFELAKIDGQTILAGRTAGRVVTGTRCDSQVQALSLSELDSIRDLLEGRGVDSDG